MSVRSLACPSCAAPVHVLPDVQRLQCPYCTTLLIVERSGAEASLQLAEHIAGAIESSNAQTRDVIQHGTYVTQAELRRLQLAQDLAMSQNRLAIIQSEIRAIQRLPQTAVTRQQLYEVRMQEFQLRQHIRAIESALNPTATSAASRTVSISTKRATGNKDLLWLLFSPTGRIGRGQYWLGIAIVCFLMLVVVGVSPFADGCAGLLLFVLLWCGFAVSAKRYHDLNKSAWWMVVVLIPVIGIFWYIFEVGFWPGTPGPNRYGSMAPAWRVTMT